MEFNWSIGKQSTSKNQGFLVITSWYTYKYAFTNKVLKYNWIINALIKSRDGW